MATTGYAKWNPEPLSGQFQPDLRLLQLKAPATLQFVGGVCEMCNCS